MVVWSDMTPRDVFGCHAAWLAVGGGCDGLE